VLVAVSYDNDFNTGYRKGQQQATDFWTHNFNSNCKYISTYEQMIENYIQDTYDYKHYDSSSTQYFEMHGAAEGMEEMKDEYVMHCSKSNNKNYDDDYVSIPRCSLIGQNTASTIAEEYASHPQSGCDYKSSGVRVSKKISTGKFGNTNECITIANDDCKGHMYDEIQNYCPKQSNNYSLLSQLKMKCQSEVTDSINA
jgi:hypothetical protein